MRRLLYLALSLCSAVALATQNIEIPSGDGGTGPSGPTGLTGATGITGAGSSGASGQTGASGRTGASGQTGSSGTSGATGATGAGTNGAQGATGATGAGADTTWKNTVLSVIDTEPLVTPPTGARYIIANVIPLSGVPVSWDHLANMNTTGGDSSGLDKNGVNNNWGDAIAYSDSTISTAGGASYVEWIVSNFDSFDVIGLTDSVGASSYTSVKFGVQAQFGICFYTYENGTNTDCVGTPLGDGTDVVRLTIASNGDVTLNANGTDLYVFPSSATGLDLFPVAAGYKNGAAITQAVISLGGSSIFDSYKNNFATADGLGGWTFQAAGTGDTTYVEAGTGPLFHWTGTSWIAPSVIGYSGATGATGATGPATSRFQASIDLTSPAITGLMIVASDKAYGDQSVLRLSASAAIFSVCTSDPTFELINCHADPACGTSPTSMANVTLGAAGHITLGTITSASVSADEYMALGLTNGTCTALSISATAIMGQ